MFYNIGPWSSPLIGQSKLGWLYLTLRIMTFSIVICSKDIQHILLMLSAIMLNTVMLSENVTL
jgi:hypothetical protein